MFVCTYKRIYCARESVRACMLLRVVINTRIGMKVCESMCMCMYVCVFVCVCASVCEVCACACTCLCVFVMVSGHYGTRLICHFQITHAICYGCEWIKFLLLVCLIIKTLKMISSAVQNESCLTVIHFKSQDYGLTD